MDFTAPHGLVVMHEEYYIYQLLDVAGVACVEGTYFAIASFSSIFVSVLVTFREFDVCCL